MSILQTPFFIAKKEGSPVIHFRKEAYALKKKRDLLFPGLLVLLAVILAVRAFYGFCWSDESFYLTFSHRLLTGQQLIVDEWHPVQFYAAMLHPVFTAYRFLFGVTGIYLFARLSYVALALAVALFCYKTMVRYYASGAAFLCAAIYLSYSRGNIWGLSYYNLFLTLLVLALCLLLRCENAAGRQHRLFLSGLCLAGSVLCVPYFAVAVILALGVGLFTRRRKDALWICAGVASAAAAFVLFFLPRDLGAVVENLRYILSDPEHTQGPLAIFLVNFRDVLFLYHRELLAALLITAAVLVGKGLLPSVPAEPVCMVAITVGAALSLWRYRNAEAGFLNYTLVIYCLPLLALSWVTRRIDYRALAVRALGVTMGLCFGLSSNTEAMAFTIGLAMYAMGTVLQLEYLTRQGRERRYRLWGMALVCLCLVMTMQTRIRQVFRDGPLSTLDTVMEQGPAAGIHTTTVHAEQYEGLLALLEELDSTYSPENSIFISKLMPWGYLVTDIPCGAPTAWRTAMDSPRLESYYTEHPDRIPEIVVILSTEVGDYPNNPSPNENASDGWLWDYMTENQYEKTEHAYAEVYVAPWAIRKEK